MKKSKRLSALAMIFLAIAMLAACSSTQTGNQASSGSNTSNTSSASTGSEPQKAAPLENYPDKTVNVLVGYAPGGGTDITARSFIKALNDEGIVKQSFTVENLPGASGVQSFSRMLQKPDDPYALLAVSELGVPILNGALDATYSDFTPIAQIANDTLVIVVSENSKYKTINDLINALKSDPQSVSIATSGALDSSEPFRWYSILEQIGVEGELNIIPMKGTSESVTAVMGGSVDAAMVNPANALGQVKAGKLIGLAILSKERFEEFADVPTLVESGVNVVHNRSRGVWIGGKVSEEVAAYWEEQFKKMMETESWKKYLKDNMLKPDFLGREDYKKYLEQEGPQFADYIKSIQQKRS